jgi:hypothetical protein
MCNNGTKELRAVKLEPITDQGQRHYQVPVSHHELDDVRLCDMA